ncbi:hypothetical protein SAMN05216207_101187 [Pseudonocardia ammonioxydans]|uniref:Uncharacterized protein n=1 Tax=Pseudonocardia ammonioxydans TaxID=260086 RepID=A0A1I4XJ93_PSUAM|nr:hypothetical protein SAMN05216207_101187 [Pseudonocardia ammonioxydans]
MMAVMPARQLWRLGVVLDRVAKPDLDRGDVEGTLRTHFAGEPNA